MKSITLTNGSLQTAWKLSTTAEWPFAAEMRFHPTRKWRFDFASRELMLAVEIEGIVYQGKGGRHQRSSGINEDCVKYLTAQSLGWTVCRVTPKMINDDPVGTMEMILAVAEHCKKRG